MAAPPTSQVGPVAWARENLFNGIVNTLTTVVIIVALAAALAGTLELGRLGCGPDAEAVERQLVGL